MYHISSTRLCDAFFMPKKCDAFFMPKKCKISMVVFEYVIFVIYHNNTYRVAVYLFTYSLRWLTTKIVGKPLFFIFPCNLWILNQHAGHRYYIPVKGKTLPCLLLSVSFDHTLSYRHPIILHKHLSHLF